MLLAVFLSFRLGDPHHVLAKKKHICTALMCSPLHVLAVMCHHVLQVVAVRMCWYCAIHKAALMCSLLYVLVAMCHHVLQVVYAGCICCWHVLVCVIHTLYWHKANARTALMCSLLYVLAAMCCSWCFASDSY